MIKFPLNKLHKFLGCDFVVIIVLGVLKTFVRVDKAVVNPYVVSSEVRRGFAL